MIETFCLRTEGFSFFRLLKIAGVDGVKYHYIHI